MSAVDLSPNEIKELVDITTKGYHHTLTVRNAYIILNSEEINHFLDKNIDKGLMKVFRVKLRTIQRVTNEYRLHGISSIIKYNNEEPPSAVEKNILRVYLSPPPKGKKRWTLALIGNQVGVSGEMVRVVLGKHGFKTR